MPSLRRFLAGSAAVVGLALVASSVLLVRRPELLPPEVYDVVTEVGASLPRTELVLALGLLVACYGLYRAWRTPTTADADAFRRSASTEVRVETRLVGSGVDDLVGEARAEAGSDRTVYREELRERLAELVVELERGHNGRSREDARALVESGEWTDDPRAASFVEPTVGSLSFLGRLYRWLFPRRGFDVDLAHTLIELERYGENRPGVSRDTDARGRIAREGGGFGASE